MPTVKRLHELDTWRLAHELKMQVYAIITRPKVRRDVKFCDQIRESSRSAARNIAEGFGRRDRPREFARFLMIALGSLEETQNHLQDALDERYIDKTEFDRLIKLSSRSIGAAIRLRQYLDRYAERKTGNPTPNPQPLTPNPQPSPPKPPKKENTAAQEEEREPAATSTPRRPQ
jgi:four helix bundle protein